eukprot:5415033-Heterocapsa_arctica.AAC.1
MASGAVSCQDAQAMGQEGHKPGNLARDSRSAFRRPSDIPAPYWLKVHVGATEEELHTELIPCIPPH